MKLVHTRGILGEHEPLSACLLFRRRLCLLAGQVIHTVVDGFWLVLEGRMTLRH